MFFNRFGKQALISHPRVFAPPSLAKTSPKTKFYESKDGIGKRRAIALALAAQFAIPFGMMSRNASVQAADSELEFSKTPTASGKSLGKSLGKSGDDAFSKLFGTPRNAMPVLSAASGLAGDQFKKPRPIKS